MPIRRIDEQNRTVQDEPYEGESPIHEQGYPANEAPAADHSPYGLTAEAKTLLKTIAGNILYTEERQKELAEEKKTFYAQAKAAGFDSTALRQAMAFLKDEAGRTETEQLRDLYVEALRERAE